MGFSKSLLYWLDDQRLRLHFRYVEHVLRAQEVSHLPQSLQENRARHLDQLHAYARRGIFPRNHDCACWTPYFMDRDGRECAVAHLVIQSGHAAAAHKIALAANNALILDMNLPELDAWRSESGFTKAELAFIQPTYVDPELIGRYSQLVSSAAIGWILLAATGLFTLIALAASAVPISFPRVKRVGVGLAVGLSALVLFSTILLVWAAVNGFWLLQQAANLRAPMMDVEVARARAAFPTVVAQAAIGVIITLIVSTFSIKRWRKLKQIPTS